MESQDPNHMCINRQEVERIIDQSTNALTKAIADLDKAQEKELEDLKTSSEKRMAELAQQKVTEAKDGVLKYIGFGGLIAICTFIYFIGGLTNQVENLQSDLTKVTEELGKGGRFTLDDGTKLKQYTDQQDQYLQKQVDSLQASVDKGFDEVKELLQDKK